MRFGAPLRGEVNSAAMATNFELVKIALDELFAVVDATTFDAQDELIAACTDLSRKYASLSDARRTPIDY